MRRAELGALLLLACACGDGDPARSRLTIALGGVAPAKLVASDDDQDDLAITVSYDDPNGDLGTGAAEIQDCRGEGLITRLDLPAIASEEAVEAGVSIRGELTLHVQDVGLVEPSAAVPLCEEAGASPSSRARAVFCVRLLDASEEASNVVCTEPVSIAE